MPPMIVHQEANYTKDLHWNLPSDWLVHNTPSGYMDRDGWMKATSLSSRTCRSRNMNPQVLLFDGHDSHFDDRATHIMRSHHISPFILKAGDSTNDQPNDNGPNLNLNRYYGVSRIKWQRHHGTMKFTPAHMNSVLVEICHSFQQQSACVIIDALKKRSSCPLPHLITTPTPKHV